MKPERERDMHLSAGHIWRAKSPTEKLSEIKEFEKIGGDCGWARHYLLWLTDEIERLQKLPEDLEKRLGENIFRFTMKVDFHGQGGCWNWTGANNGRGYGHFFFLGKQKKAHNIAYELFRGAIPPNLQLDHLCRNKACVNPEHLEPVSHKENVLRGSSPAAENAVKTSCKNGHPFTPTNTKITGEGFRACRQCDLESMRRSRDKKKRRLDACKAAG